MSEDAKTEGYILYLKSISHHRREKFIKNLEKTDPRQAEKVKRIADKNGLARR